MFIDFQDILLLIYLISALAQISIWVIYLRIREQAKVNQLSDNFPPVSVIICAKNEIGNLEENLLPIIKQEYPDYELIICDDFSTDQTAHYIQTLANKYSHVKYLKADKDVAGKKHALNFAVQHSSNKLILVTDADCKAASPHWITKMVQSLSSGTDLVLSYAPFTKEKNVLNRFIRFECVLTAIQYLSAAIRQRPYMGVGRNMMYRKSLFTKYFRQVEEIKLASGDDDLFVNKIAPFIRTSVCLDPNAFMISQTKQKWISYFNQKTRHVSSARYYSIQSKLMPISLPLSLLLFYLCFLYLVFTPYYLIAIIAFIIRELALFFVYFGWLKKLNEKDLTPWILVFDFFLVFYYITLFPYLFFTKKKNWQD